jgi:hypothetical protein
VDLHSAVPLSELADRLHPNDTGYAEVAKAFSTAFRRGQ